MWRRLLLFMVYFSALVQALTTYTNQDILTITTMTTDPPVISISDYDSPGNAYQRPWTDVKLWNANGTAASQIPGAGDVVSADFSSSRCTQSEPITFQPLYHSAASIKNYSTPRFSIVTLSNSKKCVATVHVYPDGVLNADTIVIKSGVQFVLEGLVNCNSFTLESGAMIFGNGVVNCVNITLSGHIASGWVYWTSPEKGNEGATGFQEYSDCGPSYVPPKTGTWTTNTSMGQALTFGGTAVVNGNIWIDYRGDWNRVVFNFVLFSYPTTINIMQTFGNTLNFSVPCVFFSALAGPANLTTKTAVYSGMTTEFPWVQNCINICSTINCLAQQGLCSGAACFQSSNAPCASSTPTSISVLVNAVAEPSCSADLFVASGSTGITTSTSGGTTAANATSSATTTASTQASGGLSTTAVIVLATVIPGAVLLAVGFGVLLWFVRKRELERRRTVFHAKQLSGVTD